MFKKTGDVQQISTYNPETGETKMTCSHCQKNTTTKLTKEAYVKDTEPQVCSHCGKNFSA